MPACWDQLCSPRGHAFGSKSFVCCLVGKGHPLPHSREDHSALHCLEGHQGLGKANICKGVFLLNGIKWPFLFGDCSHEMLLFQEANPSVPTEPKAWPGLGWDLFPFRWWAGWDSPPVTPCALFVTVTRATVQRYQFIRLATSATCLPATHRLESSSLNISHKLCTFDCIILLKLILLARHLLLTMVHESHSALDTPSYMASSRAS